LATFVHGRINALIFAKMDWPAFFSKASGHTAFGSVLLTQILKGFLMAMMQQRGLHSSFLM
jgi:hypothetical protein